MLIDSIQFMNSSLDKLVKNLSDEDFKYLIDEFGPENLEFLKQRVIIPMSTWTALKDLMKKNCLLENIFFSSTK